MFIIYTMNTHIHIENHLFNKMLWDNRALQINYTSIKKKKKILKNKQTNQDF